MARKRIEILLQEGFENGEFSSNKKIPERALIIQELITGALTILATEDIEDLPKNFQELTIQQCLDVATAK